MNSKFVLAIVVVASVLTVLIYSAVTESAKAVVTVDELVAEAAERSRIRLGARVSDEDIEYQSTPRRVVKFTVRDIKGEGKLVPVVYEGAMPDTLKNGRDVILEGDYVDGTFVATSLMTQCPSKYEPPLPGEEPKQAGDYD